MTVLDQLALDLREDEDEILHAYQDSEGYLTIGVGILIDKRKGGGITPQESRYLLRNRIVLAAADLDRALPWWRTMNEVRQRVLLNMRFNMGLGNSRGGLLSFKNTLAAMERGDYEAAARGMLRSRWAKQVKHRAERLARMMETGE